RRRARGTTVPGTSPEKTSPASPTTLTRSPARALETARTTAPRAVQRTDQGPAPARAPARTSSRTAPATAPTTGPEGIRASPRTIPAARGSAATDPPVGE